MVADPIEALNARELGIALGDISEDAVRLRESSAELFAIIRVARSGSEREYPAFQAWEGVAGLPLTRVLAALGRPSGPEAYGFFTSPTDLLGGLTPVEAMIGHMTSVRDVEVAAKRFLLESPDERLIAVLHAARANAAVWRA